MNEKRILTVQDLSCLGHCSALVAQPVLSAWGHEACLLPTALLSTHTAFPDPYILQLYGSMPDIVRHWQREKLTFDAILIGYLGSVRAIDQVSALVDTLLAPGGLCILDPVMADHGNDPTIGHSHHTREVVPVLVYQQGLVHTQLGVRTTLSDVGATVCEFFRAPPPQNGRSFLSSLRFAGDTL